MPINQTVNREEVRMLVADLGYNETSQRLGIPAPTLRQWAHRGQWSTPARTDERVTLVTARPSDAHAEALAHHEGQTRLTLAKYASNAAAAIHKSVHPTRYTRQAKDIAGVMATVHRQDEGKAANSFSLNVLNLNMFSDENA